MNSLVQVSDDALPAAQFRKLKRAIESLGTERLRTGYQTTFWFDFAQKPTGLVEQVVLALTALLPAKDLRRIRGVEWWLSRMRTSNVKVDFHQDRDNAFYQKTGRTRHPLVSSVLYLNECRGGLLALTREKPNPRNISCAPTKHHFELVTPLANRFVFFDGRLTHGVLDAENRIPGKRLPREAKLRLAIAINFWTEKPLDVPGFSQAKVYRSLRKAR